METFVLMAEYKKGGCLLLAADLDLETLIKHKNYFETEEKIFSSQGETKLRISKIEVTNKSLSL